MTQTIYPLAALRALALHQQHLDRSPNAPPDADSIVSLVKHLTAVQIDTLQVVARSQYLLLWSRLGQYDLADFDRLIFEDSERRLFEYWGHAASVLPLEDYRYRMPFMQRAYEKPGSWWERWLHETTSLEVLEHVRGRIKAEGALRAADFEHKKGESNAWWGWKPAKRALEYLFAIGEVMISRRVNFQRYYDLTERVLPDWVDTQAATMEEAQRYIVEEAVRALGVCRPMQAAEYAYLKRGTARPVIEALISEGIFIEVQGELADGSQADLIVHRDNLPLLQRAAEGQLPAQRTSFLSPFDSLFWAKGRDQDFWAFRQILECYKKEKDRVWGYFCLPILHKDRLVGRFDPKVDRKQGILILKALYLQPGITPEEDLVAAVAATLRDFMAWQNATELVIKKSDPAEFGEKIQKAF